MSKPQNAREDLGRLTDGRIWQLVRRMPNEQMSEAATARVVDIVTALVCRRAELN